MIRPKVIPGLEYALSVSDQEKTYKRNEKSLYRKCIGNNGQSF